MRVECDCVSRVVVVVAAVARRRRRRRRRRRFARRGRRTRTWRGPRPRRKINHARSTRVDDGDDGGGVYARAGYITPYLSVVFARRDARVERRATHRRTDNGTTMADTNPNPRNLRDRRIADDDGADDDAERDGGAVARGDEKYMYVCE